MRSVMRLLLACAFAWGAVAHGQYPAWKSLDLGMVDVWNVGTNYRPLVATHGDSVYVAARFTNLMYEGTSWRVARFAASTGALQWQVAPVEFDYDIPWALAVDAQGDVVVTGSTGEYSTQSLRTIKFRGSDGAVLWRAPDPAQRLIGRVVRVDGAGNVLVLAGGEYDPAVARLFKYAGTDGSLLWEQDASGLADIVLDGAGNVFGTGEARPTSSSGLALRVAKRRGTDGTIAWDRELTTPSFEVQPRPLIAADAGGDLYVANNSTYWQTYVRRLAGSDGHEIWGRTVASATSALSPFALAAVPGGGIVLAGTFGRSVKYSGSGDLLWDRTYIASVGAGVAVHAVSVDAAGNAVHAGTDWNTRTGFVTKLSAINGTTTWSTTGPAVETAAIAFAGGSNPVVAVTARADERFELSLARYQGASGAKAWQVVPPPAPGDAVAADALPYCCGTSAIDTPATAIDAGGSVLVAGYEVTGGGTRMRVIKRSSIDGSLLWSRAIDDGPRAYARATALALDRTGNVIVSGTTSSSRYAPDTNGRVVKLSALDGSVLWDVLLDDGTRDVVLPHSVAIDAAGSVLLGSMATTSDGTQIRTVKLAGANGQLLWTRSEPGGATQGRVRVAVNNGDAVVAAGDLDVAYGRTRVLKYAGGDGASLWSSTLDGSMLYAGWGGNSGGLGVDGAGNVTVATIFGSTLSLGVSRLAGTDGTQSWRYEVVGVSNTVFALDREGNVHSFAESAGTVRARKLASATGIPLWEQTVIAGRTCGARLYTAVADSTGNAHLSVSWSSVPSGPTCAGVPWTPRVVTLQGTTGALVTDRVQDVNDELHASAARDDAIVFAGRGAGTGTPLGIRLVKFTTSPQTSTLGRGTVTATPYGPLAVQGATLAGNQLLQWQKDAVIDLGTIPGTPGTSVHIDFNGFGVPAGATLTLRSQAAGQSVVIEARDGSMSVIQGAVRTQGTNGAPAPDLYLHNRKGIAIHASGAIDAPRGLVLDALDASPDAGAKIANQGRVHGGTSLALFAGGVNGGGTFAADAVTLSTFGHANNPVHGAFFLDNGLHFVPATSGRIAFTANLYGRSPQVMNLLLAGDATFTMPSAWPAGITLPANNAVVLPGSVRPPNTPPPSYGGGSMIVQATGKLTLAGAAGDLVFPGGIVLKAGVAIDFDGIAVNQGWTTSGQSFQGLFFEAPAIGNRKGLIQIYGNDLNWANFSSMPTAFVRSFTLQQGSGGEAALLPADTVAPHLNTYSKVIEAAARGQCWTCVLDMQPTNMYGP